MFAKLRNYFVAGLLVLGPLFLTLIFLSYLVRLADQFFVNPVFRLLPVELDQSFKVFLTKFTIAACVFAFIVLIGMAVERFVFRKVFTGFESFLEAIPIFNRIYTAIKDIARALFGDPKGLFKGVVYFEHPRKGLYTIGFIVYDRPWEAHQKIGKDLVSVFVPSPPNPATGYCVMVPREELIVSDMSVEDAIKLVISGGTAVPLIKKL
jgi:uncharacterized membrane protein